jgi:hypothetical protein
LLRSFTSEITAMNLLLACLLVTSLGLADDPPSNPGLIVAVSGGVELYRGKGPQQISEGFVLQSGDTLVSRLGGRCSGFTVDGELFELDGPGQVIIGAAARGKVVDKIAEWISEQVSYFTGLGRRQAVGERAARDWESTIAAPMPLIPAPGGRVRASEPIFVWATVQGVDFYVVTIAPEQGDEIVHRVRGHVLSPEELEPGVEYAWKVTAQIDGGSLRSQWRSFTVMESEQEKDVNEAVKALEDLEAGVLLFCAGLHDESIHYLDAVIASGRQLNSAFRWRAKVLAEIGLYEEACDDLLRAMGME